MKTVDALIELNDSIWQWIKTHPRTTLGMVGAVLAVAVLVGLFK